MDLSGSWLVRAAGLPAAALLFMAYRFSGEPLWTAGAALCLMAALAEDRWIFDSARRVVRRRFGLLPWARSVDLPYDEVRSVFLEVVENPSPGDYAASPGSLRSLYPRLVGKGKRGWASWGFSLSSGAKLAVCAESPARKDALRAQALKVAEALGVGLREG